MADISYPSTLQAPVVLSRDHHDVSGTDSPFRETSNIYDGSAFCAGEEDKKFKKKIVNIGFGFYLKIT